MTVDQAAQPRLDIVPLSLAEANEFIQKHHRHHGILRFKIFNRGGRRIKRAARRRRHRTAGARHRDDGRTARSDD